MSPGFLLQLVVAGLAQGCLYALTALGLVVIYDSSEVVNFGQGAMGMVSAYVAWTLLTNLQVPYALALLAAIVFAFGLGVAVQSFALRRMSGSIMTQVVVTLGMLMLLEGVVGIFFGYNPKPLPQIGNITPILLGPIVLRPQDIIDFIVLAILSLLLALLLLRTKMGLAMRAITQNVYAARLMGVPVGRVLASAWGLGVLLGGVAAILSAPFTSLTPNMMDTIIVYAFVAAILGGFGSLVGAVVGGLVLGVVNSLIETFLAPELSMSIVFGLLLLVLYAKPDGLFGRRVVRKV